MGATYFISDLHLQENEPGITRLFEAFLNALPDDTEALYILGDLFEVWIGDDDDDHYNRSIEKLLRKTAQSFPVFFQHGNRDFLIGEAFSQRNHISLLEENTVIDLYGTPTLLLHGDTLCTDDKPYQAFRQEVRGERWQQDFLGKTLQQRRDMLKQIRSQSKDYKRQQQADIMDANRETVADTLKRFSVNHMIHGHTHRPAVHELDNPPSGKRYVLGDWGDSGWFLKVTPQQWKLQEFTESDLAAESCVKP